MSLGRVRASLLSFILATIATLVVGGVLLIATSPSRGPSTAPPNRPSITPTVGYEVLVRRPGGSETTLAIDEDGGGCGELGASQSLYRACRLARSLDPLVIAGEAFGSLNSGYTPSFEAIVWRARLTEGPDFCDRAGLMDAMLTRCRDAVAAEQYSVEDAGIVVTVPRR